MKCRHRRRETTSRQLSRRRLCGSHSFTRPSHSSDSVCKESVCFAPQASHSVVKQITVEELFGSSLPKEPAQTTSAAGEGTRGLAYGPPPRSVEPLLTPRLSSDPGGPALVSLFQGRDPRTAASSTEESGGRSGAPSTRRGSAGPLPPAYMNPLTDGHVTAMSLPGFMPSPLVTPQSFRETGCKVSVPFTGKTAAAAQANTPNNNFMVCHFFFLNQK